jgi:hypothetical protein
MTRLALSVALLIGLLAGCAERPALDRGAGNVANVAKDTSKSEGGIGGTGSPARSQSIAGVSGSNDKEGGIGGTGIFGTVTAFGSVVVNGQTVAFGETAIESQIPIIGQELPLSVGSAVIVEARPDEGGWIADRVSLFLPVVGPVNAIDHETATLSVMGTSISLGDASFIIDRRDYVDGKIIGLNDLRIGDRLAVSGIWKGGEVVASRIDRLSDEGVHVLNGLLLKTPEGAVLGGTAIADECCGEQSGPAFMRLLGSYRDDRFEVDQFESGPALLFDPAIERLIVEAFLALDPDGQGYHLSGFGIPADQSATVSTPPGVRALFVGAYDEAFRIQYSIALPENGAEGGNTPR